MMYTAVTIGLSVGAVIAFYCVPQLIRLAQVRHWNQINDCIALTYDDGPDERTTPALLDLLDELGVVATFYLVGFRSENCLAVLERMRTSRHELGAHSHSHWHAWKVWPWSELLDAERGYTTLAQVISPTGSYRPPFGKISLLTLLAMWWKGRKVQWWSVATNDTDDELESAEAVAEQVLEAGHTVVLMHCHHDELKKREYVLALTRALVERARARGLKILTMEQLSNGERVLGSDDGSAGSGQVSS